MATPTTLTGTQTPAAAANADAAAATTAVAPKLDYPHIPPNYLPDPSIPQTAHLVTDHSSKQIDAVCETHRDRLSFLFEHTTEDDEPIHPVSLSMALWFLASLPLATAKKADLVVGSSGHTALKWGDPDDDYISVRSNPKGTIHCLVQREQHDVLESKGFSSQQQVLQYIQDHELSYLLK